MRSLRLAAAAGLCALMAACATGASPGGRADETGDPAAGRAYAVDHCATCHAVRAEDESSPNPLAPTFAAVANTPGFTRIALNAWLHTSHENMPDLIVDTDRIDDIYAYLRTLRARR